MEILNKSSSNIREEKEEERRKADQLPSPSSFLHETNHGLCCFLAWQDRFVVVVLCELIYDILLHLGIFLIIYTCNLSVI